MTKFFILILFGVVILMACKQEPGKEQTDNGQNSLKYDTAKIAIIPWDRNSRYPFDSVNHQAATLSQEDFRQLDSLFVICVTDHNNSLSAGHDEYKIDIRSNNYKKQLVVATNSRGEKVLWVNCFCDDWQTNWRTKILSVHDGGPCYFSFKVNLMTKKIYDLAVNGFA